MNFKKLLLGFLLTASFVFSGNAQGATGREVVINNFNLTPNVVPTTSGGKTQFQMTLRLTMNVAEFNNTCGSNTNKFAWYVYAGVDFKKASGEQTINRTSSSLSFNLDRNITVDVSAPELRGGTFNYYAAIYCPGFFGDKLTESSKVRITFGTASTTDKTWACVAANNKYSCSPGNLTNCSDASACSGRPCVQVGKNLCGQDAGTGPVQPPGGGTGTCGGQGQPACKPGETKIIGFEIPNPLKGGADDLAGLVKVIAQWLFNLAIPIAVIMIIYAGVLFLTARGNPTTVTKAKNVLWYAVVGLAIILIGSGFVTLIQSILELGAPPAGTNQPTFSPPGGTNQPSVGAVGNKCSGNRDCSSGLQCRNTICQRQSGNLAGEPCNGGTNCASGLACDQTSAASVIIDGQRLGTCYQP